MDDMLRSRIQYLRQRKKLSQDELALLVDMNQSQVSKIESGQRKLLADELPRFAIALDVTITELLDNHSEHIRKTG